MLAKGRKVLCISAALIVQRFWTALELFPIHHTSMLIPLYVGRLKHGKILM